MCSLVRTEYSSVAVKTKTAGVGETGSLRKGKVRKEFWLNASLLRRAQKDLGTATERETVEMALAGNICPRGSPGGPVPQHSRSRRTARRHDSDPRRAQVGKD